MASKETHRAERRSPNARAYFADIAQIAGINQNFMHRACPRIADIKKEFRAEKARLK